MMLRCAIACAVVFSGVAVQAQAPAAAAAPTERIEGRVVDALSHPLAAVDVWVTDAEDRVVARTKTDGEGMFVAAKLTPQLFWNVRATAPDRIVGKQWMRPRGGIGIAQLKLHDAATLRGRVVDADGAGIAGAEVIASFNVARAFPAENPVGTTDAEGRFRLDKVPLGLIDVRAAATGFVGGGQRLLVARDGDVEVKLAAGDGLAIDVEIEGLTAEEATKVRVDLLPYGSGGLHYLPPRLVRGTVAATGKWSVRGLPELQYLVTPFGFGLSFEPRDLQMYQQFRGYESAVMPAPTTSPIARFRAFRTSQVAVSGRLLSDTGEGLAGETLVVSAINGGPESTATTGERGAFAIESPVAPGSEAVFVLRGSKWVTDQDGAQDHRDPRRLLSHRCVIDPKAELVIRAIPATSVRGRLVDFAGKPVGLAPVQLQAAWAGQPSWRRYASTTSRADGSFELSVHARTQPVRVEADCDDGFALSEPFALELGATVQVGDLKLSRPASIHGVVRDARQQPVAGARVRLLAWDLANNRPTVGPMEEVITDRAGSYRLAAVAPGGAYLVVLLDAADPQQEGLEPFEVKAGDALSRDLVVGGR